MENDIKFVNEELQEVMNRMPSALIKYSNSVILLIIILFVFISWLIKIPEKVIGVIALDSSFQNERVLAKSNSKIETILVKSGAKVNKNDYLIVLNNSADYIDVLKLKRDINFIELSNDITKFNNDEKYNLGEVQVAFNEFKTAFLNLKLYAYSNEIYKIDDSGYSYDSNQILNKISYVQDQINNSEKELILKKREFERFEALFKKGIISQQEFETRIVDFSVFDKSVKNYYTELSNLKSKFADLKSQDKKILINKKKGEININEELKTSISNLKKSIAEWEFNNVVKANFDGVVFFKKTLINGIHVNENEHLLTVFTGVKRSIIGSSKSNSVHSGMLKNNQEAVLKLYNYPHNNFGCIIGKVANVSNIIDEEGYVYFDVHFPEELVTTHNKKIKFKPGLKGVIEIKVSEKRLINRILNFEGLDIIN